MQTLHVDLGTRSYPIYIGAHLIEQSQLWQSILQKNLGATRACDIAIVTNTTLAPLYAYALQQLLRSLGHRLITIELPDGEAHKHWQTLNLIFDALLQNNFGRDCLLIALGGGVVGDMTGFAAASFMRGVPFVQVPTTLLAQVDSSVGGKTAINHPLGKNMIGAFYQPIAVLADTETLRTLPARELKAGLAEVIKHGAIADAHFFAWLETHMPKLLASDAAALTHAVARSCEIKANVVRQDEREQGLRETLNFGHTFGHAIETGLGYGAWLHGEAVAAGMIAAASLSEKVASLPKTARARLLALVGAAGLPTQLPALKSDSAYYLDLMRHDKKSKSGTIRYVLLSALGHAHTQKVADDIVAPVLAECTAAVLT